MKINLNKVTNKWLLCYLLDKYKTNCVSLNNNICIGVDKRIWIADNKSNKVIAIDKKNVIEYLKTNNIDLNI